MSEVKINEPINVKCGVVAKKIINESGDERLFLSYTNQDELLITVLKEIQSDIIDYVALHEDMSIDDMAKCVNVIGNTVITLKKLGA